MRTTGDETTEGQSSGGENASGQDTTGGTDPTQVGVETTGDRTADPETDQGGGPADSLGTEGDTADLDQPFGDVSEEEAEEVVSEVFGTVYGEDGDNLLDQVQDSLGLGFREILDILVGNNPDDAEEDTSGAYGEGAGDETGTGEPVDSSVDPSLDPGEDGTGSGDPGARPDAGDNDPTGVEADPTDPSASTDPMAEDPSWDGNPDDAGDIDLTEPVTYDDPADSLDPG